MRLAAVVLTRGQLEAGTAEVGTSDGYGNQVLFAGRIASGDAVQLEAAGRIVERPFPVALLARGFAEAACASRRQRRHRRSERERHRAQRQRSGEQAEAQRPRHGFTIAAGLREA